MNNGFIGTEKSDVSGDPYLSVKTQQARDSSADMHNFYISSQPLIISTQETYVVKHIFKHLFL